MNLHAETLLKTPWLQHLRARKRMRMLRMYRKCASTNSMSSLHVRLLRVRGGEVGAEMWVYVVAAWVVVAMKDCVAKKRKPGKDEALYPLYKDLRRSRRHERGIEGL